VQNRCAAPLAGYHDSRETRIGRIVLVSFALWTIFGLFAAFQMYAVTSTERAAYSLRIILISAMADAWLKALISIPLLYVARALSAFPVSWMFRFGVYVVLLPLFILAHVGLRSAVVPLLVKAPGAEAETYFMRTIVSLRWFFLDDAWGFCCLVLGFHAWQYADQTRLRTLREERLQARLAQAELQVLKMQLQPHFLFNTLNTIYHLIPRDSVLAQQMITRLSDLLRLSLDHVSTNVIAFHRELEFLNSYLEIEKTRFKERLRVQMEIEPDTLDAAVPNMLLQPLVENALRHGIARKAEGGKIYVSACKAGPRVVIQVRDDGGTPPPQTNSPGIGVANTRSRLAQLYGDDFRFDIVTWAKGTRVILDIPYSQVPAQLEEAEVV
jgi:two-component sensor histidine kinase